MGIPNLWDVIKDHDHSVPIAQLAEEHHRQHRRPLRVAIDEADWRFNNLTQQQVYAIREKKTMFFRICRLLTLNIQLLFVFDGPRRLWKRGRRGQGKIDYEARKPLKEMLQHFGIPHHEAPGEAEAECARLQMLGVVDAVFSQDSDSLMFGCDFLIRDDRVAKQKENKDRSKENTQKSAKTVKVIRSKDIQANPLRLDREGLVLFAMLCGGDYDTKGLPGCGTALAMRVFQAGIGASLCRCRTQKDCGRWQEELILVLQSTARGRSLVPTVYRLNFPDVKILDKYNRPTVSTDDQLRNLRGLRGGWDKSFDELKLLDNVTGPFFNYWGKRYMNWVGPILLTRALIRGDATSRGENIHEITPVKQRGKKNGSDSKAQDPLLERKLRFSPFKSQLTCLEWKHFEGRLWNEAASEYEVRDGAWTGERADCFEPDHRVECEIPSYWLQQSLPPEIMDPPTAQSKRTPVSQKRKRKESNREMSGTSETPSDKIKRTKKSPSSPLPNSKASAQEPQEATNWDSISPLSDTEDEDKDPLIDIVLHPKQPLPGYTNHSHIIANPRLPHSLVPKPSNSILGPPDIVNLGPEPDDSEADADLNEAIRLSLQVCEMTPGSSQLGFFTPRKESVGTFLDDNAQRKPLGEFLSPYDGSSYTPRPPMVSPLACKSKMYTSTVHERIEKDLDARVPQPGLTNSSAHVDSAGLDPLDRDQLRMARLRHFGTAQKADASPAREYVLPATPSTVRSGTRDEPITIDD
ncbi:hypothetical protein K491DRAFT_500378 [Lophiostoma macrostomum CBS 122681]|uniref:PIN domain-like protein n=1 Tax=Lophiostoma macrostomum CBS 122681 TaxID=1314788 RepID=A0A6A6T3C0_9PLEO|nr:hypothetical protein K491DRAFT_500378 [Lophiostoma macrostomum CBS 122681]